MAYKVTASLCDENGTPLDWKIKAVSTEEYERIREKCTTEVQVTGKPGVYRQKFNSSLFIAKLMCASVAEPDLYNKELQDSYVYQIPAIANIDHFEFKSNITFFVGENGSGKSTLLEAFAVACV